MDLLPRITVVVWTSAELHTISPLICRISPLSVCLIGFDPDLGDVKEMLEQYRSCSEEHQSQLTGVGDSLLWS